MAIYHLHVKNISRRDGRSAVAAAAYRAGETLPNDAEEKDSVFGGRRDVVFSKIYLPAEAPAWMGRRAVLWNAAEAAEQRKDARLAKEIEFSLPRELPREMWVAVAREMADLYTSRGYVVDLAIHDDGLAHNPHVHLLLATRAVSGDGFGGKIREADHRKFVVEARLAWAGIANAALGKIGAGVQVDARSNADRGLARPTGGHRGPDPGERRARRKWARALVGERKMDLDTLESRRELLAHPGVRDQFPLLAARPDWPPEDREPPGGLNQAEHGEFKAFWREVDRRRFEEQDYERPRDGGRMEHPASNAPRPVESARVGPPQERDVNEDARAVTDRFTVDLVSARAIKEWDQLEQALHARLRAAGREPGPPTDWEELAEEMARFRATLAELREMEVGNRIEREKWAIAEPEERLAQPVPDPDGRMISRDELENAEDLMIEEVTRPVRQVPSVPRPEKAPAAERAEARDAVERQNAVEVSDERASDFRLAPQEDNLDWLRDGKCLPPTSEDLIEPRREDELDWARDDLTQRTAQRHERTRER